MLHQFPGAKKRAGNKKNFFDGISLTAVELLQMMMAILHPTDSRTHPTVRSLHGAREYDNQALIDGLKNGCSGAAVAFCRRYGPRINRWVWRLLGTDTEHDEMVQQVYLGFFVSFKKLKNVDSLDAFVDSITIRTVRKEIRKRKIRRLFFSRTAQIDYDTEFSQPPLRDVYKRTFYRMLDKLTADERTIFVLKHFEGLSLDDIARRSGYSLRTTNRRLSSGRAKLKELMMKETVLIHLSEER